MTRMGRMARTMDGIQSDKSVRNTKSFEIHNNAETKKQQIHKIRSVVYTILHGNPKTGKNHGNRGPLY